VIATKPLSCCLRLSDYNAPIDSFISNSVILVVKQSSSRNATGNCE